MSDEYVKNFIQTHRLPPEYIAKVDEWFRPLAKDLSLRCNGQTLRVAINGTQGSGKSTLADLLACVLKEEYSLSVAVISIDDFYLTRNDRATLATQVHPLFITRGVPGTHDIALAEQVVDQLCLSAGEVSIPRFDKSIDDRFQQSQWNSITSPVDIVIVEGWCMGATAQEDSELDLPVNNLEEEEDCDCIWRNYVNLKLKTEYEPFFNKFDVWVMLKAPSFNCVYRWRLEQEKKLIERVGMREGVMSEEEIKRFIQFYQRITEHMLTHLPSKVHCLFELDDMREIVGFKQPVNY